MPVSRELLATAIVPVSQHQTLIRQCEKYPDPLVAKIAKKGFLQIMMNMMNACVNPQCKTPKSD
jgi:hypothetical protein